MAEKVTIATQMTEGSRLYSEFEEWEENFESRSEALRGAIRQALLFGEQ